MITKKIQNICFPRELGPLPGKTSLFPKEGAILPKELEASPRKIHCSLGKLYFSQRNYFIPWGTYLGLALSLFFACGSYFLKATNFKNYLSVLGIFTLILFVAKKSEKTIEP
jgi:hypothetical protein